MSAMTQLRTGAFQAARPTAARASRRATVKVCATAALAHCCLPLLFLLPRPLANHCHKEWFL